MLPAGKTGDQMRWVVAVVTAVMVTGCTKSVSEMNYTELREYAASLLERCRAQGVPDAELEFCAQQEFRLDQAKRARQREIGAAIAKASADYNRSVQANRPINCTSTGYGGFVRTTCY